MSGPSFLLEPTARTRDRVYEMETELRHGKPGAYTLAAAVHVPHLLDEVERLTALLAKQPADDRADFKNETKKEGSK